MRQLILMRHAKSSWADPGQRDLDRPLNKRGRKSAGLVGEWLKERGYLPAHALVSSARRTQETWAGVVAAAGAAPTTYLPDLYHAAAESMLALLQAAPDVERLLMLGHQPGIGTFAARLVSPTPAGEAFAKYPTGATAVVAFDVDTWQAVGWGSGRLLDFVVPRELD